MGQYTLGRRKGLSHFVFTIKVLSQLKGYFMRKILLGKNCVGWYLAFIEIGK